VLAATVIGAAFHTTDLAATTFFLHRKPPRWGRSGSSAGQSSG